MRIAFPTLLLLAFACPIKAAESRQVTGRVLDEKGNPVKDAAIDSFWSANGPVFDQDGKPIDRTTDEAQKQYWGRVGQMEPFRRAKSDTDGRFSIEITNNFHTLMAIDAQ